MMCKNAYNESSRQVLSTPAGPDHNDPWLEGHVMAESQGTSARIFFQPAPDHDTLNAAYLLARLAKSMACAANGCWEWCGERHKDGYGKVSVAGGRVFVHRLIHELCVGPIPMGAQVLHRCDNPPCCNPTHLFTGTNRENVDDMVAKGRHRRGEGINTAKMTTEKVRNLRTRHKAGVSVTVLSADYGISEHQVRCIIGRRSWRHVADEQEGGAA